MTDALEIHFIDVKKFNALPEKDIRNDALHRWLTFFDQNISEDLLKELIDMDAAIYKANEKLTFLANDKEALRLYHMRELAQIDYNSGMRRAKDEGKKEGRIEGKKEGRIEGKKEGRIEGKKEGRIEGKKEGKIETARNLKEMNMPHEQIAKATGLTLEEIKNL